MLSRPVRLTALALLLALVSVLLAPRVAAAPLMIAPLTAPLMAPLTAALMAPLTAWTALPPAEGVQPSEASLGTQLTITGSGFGLAKPKVLLQSTTTTKHPSLKVLSFNDTTVVARLDKKVAPGTWDVVVQPKGKGSQPVVFANALSVRAPQFLALDPPEAAPGDSVALHGRYFGTTKGSVKIGGKAAKVLSWTDTQVNVQVPSKLTPGGWDLLLKNKLGTFTEPCALIVPGAGGSFGACPDKVTALLGSTQFSASGFLSVFGFGVMGVPDQLIVVGVQPGPPRMQLQLVIPFDVTMPHTASIAGDLHGFLRVEQGGGPFDPATTVWTTEGQGNDYAVEVTGVAGGKVTGHLQGLLMRVQGADGDPSLQIPDGTFRVTIGP